jgi:hypothetical protein
MQQRTQIIGRLKTHGARSFEGSIYFGHTPRSGWVTRGTEAREQRSWGGRTSAPPAEARVQRKPVSQGCPPASFARLDPPARPPRRRNRRSAAGRHVAGRLVHLVQNREPVDQYLRRRCGSLSRNHRALAAARISRDANGRNGWRAALRCASQLARCALAFARAGSEVPPEVAFSTKTAAGTYFI